MLLLLRCQELLNNFSKSAVLWHKYNQQDDPNNTERSKAFLVLSKEGPINFSDILLLKSVKLPLLYLKQLV